MTKILAGPRLDSLRFALCDESAILFDTYERIDRIQEGFFELKSRGIKAPSTAVWGVNLARVLDMADDKELADDPIDGPPTSWFSRDNKSGHLDPFGVLNRGTVIPEWLPKVRLDLSRSGYCAAFHSPHDGPGYMAIKDRLNPNSNVHWVQFDLSSSWLWEFETAHDAATAAIQWWCEQGILNEKVCLALIDSFDGHRVTRADVCVDHVLDGEEWTKDDLERFAGRAKSRGFAWLSPPREKNEPDAEKMAERKSRRRELYTGPRSFTLYVGCRKATFLRVYDKIAELGRRFDSAKCVEVWRRNGWNEAERVWRAEIQVCSKSLQYLNTYWGEPMRQLDALSPHQLWTLYCDSMRHVDLTASRLTRCPTSKRWEALQDASGDTKPAHRSPIEAKEAHQNACVRELKRALERCMIEGVGFPRVWQTCAEHYQHFEAIAEDLAKAEEERAMRSLLDE